MIVRFDGKALQQNVERKSEPIGVEGDPPSTKKGGISEADALVSEARKSLGDIPGSLHLEDGVEEERARVSKDIIREEEEKEPGPELDETRLKNFAKR